MSELEVESYIHIYMEKKMLKSKQTDNPILLCCARSFLYISFGNYSLKSTLNYRFLRNFSWQFYFILRVFAWNPLIGRRLRNILTHYVCVQDVWAGGLNRGPTFNNITHYLLDHGDFWYSLNSNSKIKHIELFSYISANNSYKKKNVFRIYFQHKIINYP